MFKFSLGLYTMTCKRNVRTTLDRSCYTPFHHVNLLKVIQSDRRYNILDTYSYVQRHLR